MTDPNDNVVTSKTTLRRQEQFRDRWTTWSQESGLAEISERPTPERLRKIEIFREFDDAFLEKISPDVSLATWREGSVLFEEGTYIDLAFFLESGEVDVYVEREGSGPLAARPIFDLDRTSAGQAFEPASVPERGTQLLSAVRPEALSKTQITFLASMDFDLPRGSVTRLGPGELFGEIGAMSGWPQSTTVRTASECHVVQIRLPALRAIKRKSKALKERLDTLYRQRSLFTQLQMAPLFDGCNPLFLQALMEVAQLVALEPGEVLVREGEPASSLFLLRSGFLRLAQRYADGKLTVNYLSKGMTLGEIELLLDDVPGWQCTASSVEYAELVEIPKDAFENLVRTYPDVEKRLWATATARIKEAGFSRRTISHSELLQVALDGGLVQGNSILAIDLGTCTRCDDCVRACAATHGGRPRFVREGEKVDNLLLARSCYHCRDPVCLVGCPTGAIHRAGVEAVVAVDEEICIGCSTCARNCPYDAIVMHDTEEVWPDDMVPTGLRGRPRQVASKCDLCFDTGHGPACVSNCPQGCAFRVGSLEEFESLLEGGGP